MQGRSHFYVLLALCLLSRVGAAEGKWPEFDLIKADPARLPASRTVKVSHDPVYQSAKDYQAYPLADILKKIAVKGAISADDRVIVFSAVDGYKVAMAYQDALSEEGFIAFEDNAATEPNKWVNFKFGKQTMTPAPFYLVWPKKGLDEWRYPWPFQLASISVQPAKAYYGAAAPVGGDQLVNNGFNLFSRYCIRCHSVNHSGGEVGPELNMPKNITEYFKEGELAGFILNAASYRAGSKMPVFAGLISHDDAQAIVAYLKHMKSEKKN